MKQVLFLATLLFVLSVNAQEFHSKLTEKNVKNLKAEDTNNPSVQDYSVYFKSIALAEVNVLDSNYQEAIEIYKSTFDQYEFTFPKDAYIAAQIASYIDEDSSCLYFLKKGVKNGLPMESVKRNPHLKKWISKQNGNHYLMNTLDSLVSIYYYNNTYRDTIISMSKEDQKLRDKSETFLNAVIFNHKLKPKLYERFMKQAETQSKTILELTKKFGFPSHKTIGTHRKSDHEKFGTNYSSKYAFIILAHYDYAYQLFEDVLPEQLKLGNITPKQYALLRDFATQHYIHDGVKDIAYHDFKYFIRWTLNNKGKIKDVKSEYEKKLRWIKENITQIDSDRNKIGLIPYAYQGKMELNQVLFNKNYTTLETKSLPYFDFNYSGWD